MAKRKRLTPAQAGFLSGTAPETKSAHPPIAQVAGEAAALSALSTLSAEWDTARTEGRLIISLDLEAIEADHLVRDRAAMDGEAMESLVQSLMTRGQQTPIEVIDLGQGRYGLISGWRRLTALRSLFRETQEARFAQIQALIRQPADLAQSYVAMVEENEIRSDLSFYERARIVLKALEAGVFETEKAALQKLFSSASYAKRSKIKSFIPVVQALEGHLRFPHRLTERTGLSLAKALSDDPGHLDAMHVALKHAQPMTAEEEAACLLKVLQKAKTSVSRSEPVERGAASPDSHQVSVAFAPERITLRGKAVTPEFRDRLLAWLAGEAQVGKQD